jgi:surface antigen
MKKMLLVLLAVMSTASSSFAKNNQELGAIAGAVVGAAAGHELGGGVGAMVGAFAGTVIGSKIGENMDRASRQAWQESCGYAIEDRSGRPYEWSTPYYSGRTHYVRSTYVEHTECRAYDSTICSRGGCQTYHQASCYTDGYWREANYNRIRW